MQTVMFKILQPTPCFIISIVYYMVIKFWLLEVGYVFARITID